MTTAFPSSLIGTVTRLAPLLSPPAELEPSHSFSVHCAGETLHIPQRIYYAPPSDSAFRALHGTEQAIVACWFTRHHDGHVRERFLRALTAFDCAWIIAYVVALCGEYVIEILRYIWERRDLFDGSELGGWLRENPPFYARTRSRIVSYWHCYYRTEFPRFDDYIGSRLISFFDASITNTQSTGSA
jgi:hypothetical protein